MMELPCDHQSGPSSDLTPQNLNEKNIATTHSNPIVHFLPYEEARVLS